MFNIGKKISVLIQKHPELSKIIFIKSDFHLITHCKLFK